MILYITPEETTRLQNLAERILQYAALYPEVVTSEYREMAASVLLGDIPYNEYTPTGRNDYEEGSIECSIKELCMEDFQWTCYWAYRQSTNWFDGDRSGPTFNLDAAYHHIELIDMMIQNERPITQ